MPVLRVPADGIEKAVADIERTQRVVSMCPSGDGAFVLLVEAKRVTGDKETR